MPFETSQSSCPLCKRTLSYNLAGQAPGSRLCDQCQSIVQEAFPGPASRDSGTVNHQPDSSMVQVQHGAQVLDLAPLSLPEFTEHGSNVDLFDDNAEFPDQQLFELYDDSDLPDHESDAKQRSVEGEVDMSQHGSSQAHPGISNQSTETDSPYTDNQLAGEGTVHSAALTDSFTEPVRDAGFQNDLTAGQQSHEQTVATDPWVNPLPSWDYSQNEWPVLMGPPRSKNKSGWLRASLVALVLLSAAGFYFFILQPTLREQRARSPVGPRAPERAATNTPAIIPEAKPAEPAPTPAASAPVSETPAVVDPKPLPASEDANTHGKFSLQAAAFPSKAGADEFAEKLKRAGVPSYTVTADLGRRGTWFRVRVGRFNTADDAQKFAAEAQHRAKAAGMSLQLIGCQYDQP